MREPKSPCKGCTFETGRSIEPNCHTTCGKYLQYKREQDEWRETIRGRHLVESAMSAFHSGRRERFTKKKK